MHFGEFLKSLRQDRGLTLRQVEERGRIYSRYLSQVERGERPVPNLTTMRKLAGVYGVSVTELVDAAEQATPGTPRNADCHEAERHWYQELVQRYRIAGSM